MTPENKENSLYHSQLRTPTTAKYSKLTTFSNTEEKLTNAPISNKQSTPRWFKNPLFSETQALVQNENGCNQSIGRLNEQQAQCEQKMEQGQGQAQGFSFALESPASSVPTPDFGSHVENKYRSIFSAPNKGENMKSFNNVLLEQKRIIGNQEVSTGQQDNYVAPGSNSSQMNKEQDSYHGFVERLTYSVPLMKRLNEDDNEIGYSRESLLPLFENQNQEDENDDKQMDITDTQLSESSHCEGSPLCEGQSVRRSQRLKGKGNWQVIVKTTESGDSNFDRFVQSPRRSPRLKNKHFVTVSVTEKC